MWALAASALGLEMEWALVTALASAVGPDCLDNH